MLCEVCFFPEAILLTLQKREEKKVPSQEITHLTPARFPLHEKGTGKQPNQFNSKYFRFHIENRALKNINNDSPQSTPAQDIPTSMNMRYRPLLKGRRPFPQRKQSLRGLTDPRI